MTPFRIGWNIAHAEGDFSMEQSLIMCRSLTYAQAALRILERGGFTVQLVRAPRQISEKGCAYGLRVPRRHLVSCVELLQRSRRPIGKLYHYLPNGQLEEAEL